MEHKSAIAYQISRDFSALYCELHHLSFSTRVSKELAIVKVCCNYFKNEVEQALQKKYGHDFMASHIRVALPISAAESTTEASEPGEE